MEKVDELIQALDGMAVCAKKLTEVVAGARDYLKEQREATGASPSESKAEAAETAPSEVKDKATAAAPSEPKAKPAAARKKPKTYTFTEVRAAFAAKSHEGHTEQVKALITKYGADRLSAVKEADYTAIMAELEAIS